MLDLAHAPALFFAPFVSSTMRVEPQWIDHNQHLNMAYYNVLMDRAIDELFALIGLGPTYVAERGGTAFVLGGGGMLGAAEVGMLRALFEHRIHPDLIVGTSVGAINGAF